ncbi:hypothetical protein XELAEV_18025030mg [Xenopus laevis]|uniref:Uncharacterized protein n=1 Tax=Xenopus laevis TaxID=8355 RepID=A0A974CZZ4_XENLA|nr:hypothetical protein XELAEV_18025030mg [Xenopus laevis]
MDKYSMSQQLRGPDAWANKLLSISVIWSFLDLENGFPDMLLPLVCPSCLLFAKCLPQPKIYYRSDARYKKNRTTSRHTRDPKLCDFFCTWHRSDCWNVNCALTVAGKNQIPRKQRNEWILGQFRCVEHYQMKHVELLLIY